MARTLAELPQGARITDYVSLGVIAKTFPWAKVQAVRHRKGKTSRRQRDLPAPGVVDDVIALALYRQVSYGEVPRCLREGIAWLRGPSEPPRVQGDRAPAGVLCPRSENLLLARGRALKGMASGRAAAVFPSRPALLLVAPPPLVAGPAAHVVAPAQLGHRL